MVSILSIVVLVIVSTVCVDCAAKASNCGSGSDTIQLVNFKLIPDPIKVPTGSIPNPATFDLDVQLSEDLVQPIETKVVLETKVLFFWFEAPCENNVGSCTYPSFCDLCKTCSCPEKTGRHSMILPLNISSSVPKGDYKATIHFQSASGQRGCVLIENIVLN